MRCSATLLKELSESFKTEVHSTGVWEKIRVALVVNPELGTGNPLPLENRWPQPGSRPETFAVPASKASDIADNDYWKRDFRRQYPKTEVVTQGELATLLLVQGGFTSLPSPPSASSSDKALTADSPAPSLSAIYSSPTAVATGTFKPPTPPGKKYAWAPAIETIPHGEFAYFPMVSMSAKQI